MTLDWQDGQPYCARFGDVYFSCASGLEETRHVFLRGNRLPARFAALPAGQSLVIGETGFGTGLNILCAWQLFEQAAPPGTELNFVSVEKFPLQTEELRAALALWPELHVYATELLAQWPQMKPGWNQWSFASSIYITFTVVVADQYVACLNFWESMLSCGNFYQVISESCFYNLGINFPGL